MFPNSNFDDWKWATEQSCIHNEITSYKIPTLANRVAKSYSNY